MASEFHLHSAHETPQKPLTDSLEEAVRVEKSSRRLLRQTPRHAPAWQSLGRSLMQQGRAAEGIKALRQASALEPRDVTALVLLAEAQAVSRHLDEAMETFQRALLLDPRNAHLHSQLATVLLAAGNTLGARTHFQHAARIQPENTVHWLKIGETWIREGRADSAIEPLQRAVDCDSTNESALFELGTAWLSLQRCGEAVACFVALLGQNPRHANALNNLGSALCQLGRWTQALQAFDCLLTLEPKLAAAHVNRAYALFATGRVSEAESAARDALALEPGNVNALNNLGSALNSLGRFVEAAAVFRSGTEHCPNSADAWGNLGVAEQVLGRMSSARAAYSHSLKLNPAQNRLRIQRATMLPPLYDNRAELAECRARLIAGLSELIADRVSLDPTIEPVPVNFYLPYQGENDREVQQLAARLYDRPERRDRMRVRRPHNSGRIRVGLLSKYFTNHTIGSLYRGLISQLDRSRFHVSVFSVGAHSEAMAEEIRRAADQMVLLSEHIPNSAAAVASQQLDVLFYPDLGMDPTTWSLAFQRLATVQCVSWGHPVTTGIPTIDWFISSELLEPANATEHYTERLALFETLPAFYQRSLPAGRARDRASFGLPNSGPLYVCPQSLFKFHPDFDSLLRRILESTPNARLAVVEGAQAPWTEILRQRWRRTLSGMFDRVCWLPRQSQTDFLHLIAACDVMLDPMHFGGGHTTYQGISVGTPIVTMPARFMRGRATAACYTKMGLSGLTAADADDYVRIAVELGTNRDQLASVRQTLLQSSDVIFSDTAAVREFEAFFQSAVEQAENA